MTGMDSGRSWIVAVACFFVQVLTFGLTDASGLLFVATISRYNTTREKASMPFAITYCLRSAVGPLVSYVGRRFGIRLVTLLGCVLSAISVASCFFATDILDFTLLWGVIFGISLGFETSLLNVILNEHFDKHFVKANSLFISGSSLGTLILSPLIEHSVRTYGLSGTFLIISGLMLNSIPAVLVMMLYKPPKVVSPPTNEPSFDFQDHSNEIEVSNIFSNDKKISVSIICDKPAEGIQIHDGNYQTFAEKNSAEVNSKTSLLRKILQLRTIANNNSSSLKPSRILPRFWKFKSYPITNAFNTKENIKQNLKLSREDNTCGNNLPKLSNASTIIERTSLTCSLTNSKYETENIISTQPTDDTNSKWQLHRLLSQPIYIIIIFGSGIYYLVTNTLQTIIVDYATDLGISTDYSTYIVMWVALCNIGGYMFQSWIIELRHLSQSQFMSVYFLCMCLASGAMVWCSNFVVLLVLIVVFAVGQCGVVILAAPLVAEFMEADLHATGMASLTILSSPLTLAISPLIGYFRDGSGSYAGVYYVTSACSCLCSVLFLCIPTLQKRKHRNVSSQTSA